MIFLMEAAHQLVWNKDTGNFLETFEYEDF